jgi:hypothetical protein
MEKVHIITLMEINIAVIGLMVIEQGKVFLSGLKVASTRETIQKRLDFIFSKKNVINDKDRGIQLVNYYWDNIRMI